VSLLESPPVITAAVAQARRNFESNSSALAAAQPWLRIQIESAEPAVTWLFGRDGFLTAHDQSGRWLAGCSLPMRAGQLMMKRLTVNGTVACLLAPSHAGQIAAALEKLTPQQAVIVLQPDAGLFQIMLRCCDFSEAIQSNRLWFAVGEQWGDRLGAIFENRPGLLTPCQFIRTLATDEDLMQQLIPPAERIFQAANESRTHRLTALMVAPPRQRDRRSMLIVAGSHFRLWDDAGPALVQSLSHSDWSIAHCDPDDPAQTSAVGLALAADGRDAVVLPHRSRSDLPGVFRKQTRVLSWITQPRIPAFDADSPHDGLLLADDVWLPLATSAGWPRDRVTLAAWPAITFPTAPEKSLALIANTRTLETPTTTLDLSSHHVLWDMIRSDLLADPFSIGTDVHSFIDRRLAKLQISDEGFDRDRFINDLIVPAYQQGLVKLLANAKLPIQIFGTGWNDVPALRSFWRGEVSTRQSLAAAVVSASVLLYAWPLRYRHQIDAMGRPVLTPHLGRPTEFIRDARRLLSEAAAPPKALPFLSLDQLEPLLS
jgi:hypothetical protein